VVSEIEEELKALMGKTGTAQCSLRPSGVVMINQKPLNAVTQGEFVEKNADVLVIGLKETALLVQRTSPRPEGRSVKGIRNHC